jgi:hypothetical protein
VSGGHHYRAVGGRDDLCVHAQSEGRGQQKGGGKRTKKVQEKS